MAYFTVSQLIAFSCYHLIDYTIKGCNINFSFNKLLLFFVEFILYSVQPIPNNMTFVWSIVPIGEKEPIVVENYRVDIILSLLMVSRFVLFLRSFLLHKKIFANRFDVIARINAVNPGIRFKLKYLMFVQPATLMCIFNLVYLVVASWAIRLTER